MSVAADPKLGGGAVASVLLHGGIVAAFFLLRAGAPAPAPPIYRVHLIAAPRGERAVGVVQEETPVTKPPVETPPPPSKVAPTRPVPAPPKAKPKPTKAVKAATPLPETKQPPPPNTPAPKAGGGATGGNGADVADVLTPGIEFNYPPYTDNIVRQLLRYFNGGSFRYTAEVRFVIRRDGTVDPESIGIVTRSGNFDFDTRALGAVEAAARAKAFGPLPAGFREDILPVRFRFTPNNIR